MPWEHHPFNHMFRLREMWRGGESKLSERAGAEQQYLLQTRSGVEKRGGKKDVEDLD